MAETKELFEDISPTHSNLAELHKEKIMKELAWHIRPINMQDNLSGIAKNTGLKNAQVKQYINEMVTEGKIVTTNEILYTSRTFYRLPFQMYASILAKIKNDPKGFTGSPLTNWYAWTESNWIEAIHLYLQGKDITLKRLFDVTDDYILHVLMYMPLYAELTPFFEYVSSNVKNKIFHLWAQEWELELKIPNEQEIKKGFLENETFSPTLRKEYKERYSSFRNLLSGHVGEIGLPDSSDNPYSLCAYAVRLQYEGKTTEAIRYYQHALKIWGTPLTGNVLFDTYYVIALNAEKTPANRKKLSALLKKKEVKNNLNALPLLVVIYQSLGLETNELVEIIMVNKDFIPPLPRVLALLLIRHYHLDEKVKINDKEVQQIIDRDDLKLLQLECSQDFMPFIAQADDLRRQTELSPLLPPYAKKEKWEKIIASLMDRIQDNETDRCPSSLLKGEAQSRIVYHVSRYGEIIPRLQKSKDGVIWSKGRNIALSTFRAGIPEMNERDKIMAGYIKHYPGGWGYNERWELQGPKALTGLAGYPLVFSDHHPDIPVVITKEEAQITITKCPKGFRIESNVGKERINSNTILHIENDFRFQLIELTSEQRELLNILSEQEVFPQEAEKQLSALLPRLSRKMTVHSDLVQSESHLKKTNADTKVTVLLQPTGEGIKAELFVKPFVDQPPYCKAGKGNVSVIGTVNEEKVQAMRDFKKEKLHLQKVMEWLQPMCSDHETEEGIFFFNDSYLCLDMLEVLQNHLDSIRIEWPQGGKISIKGSADFKNLALSVKGVGQWFELEGELKINNQTIIGIAELLQKVRNSKGRFVALSENEFIALSDKLKKQLQTLEVLLTQEKEKLKLPSFTANTLLEIEQEGGKLKKGNEFSKLVKRMETAENQPVTVPKQLKAELRSYQIDGFRWMSRLASWEAGACLADDMGLGKTLQAIALMLSRGKQGASLVVVPASVVINWKNELERFAPSLTPLVMNENGCDRKAVVENATEYDVVITTYGLLINEADTLASKTWNIITLDEAHIIKNKETKMSQAAMKLNGNFRLLLTGTPLQNHLSEIWNLFQFATPGLLGSFQQFTDRFIVPIEKNGDKNRQRQLKRLLQPFILRRNKNEVLDELPEKTEIILHVELSEKERALYETLRREAMNNLEEKSATAIQTLAEITKLRQAACHPSLVQPELQLPSAKSAAFLKLVEELIKNNHRALVFSQFTSHLSLIRKELDKAHIDYLYLDGSVSITDRSKLVKTFQTGEQPLFLISLKAGGLGLNLTAADYVIHLDPWWNPAIEDQASDRAYRIGQRNHVTVYRLIATHTIEEKIIRLHQSKKSLADSLLDGSDMAHKLTKEEMLELLREKDF